MAEVGKLGVVKWVDGAIEAKKSQRPIVGSGKLFITDVERQRIVIVQIVSMRDLNTLGHGGNLDKIKRFFVGLGYKLVKHDVRERTAEIILDKVV